MIPRIVHYCWLSGDPIPKNLQKCMATWKAMLPGWEFRLWDKSRFNLNSVEWVRQAYEARKYAFAADYIRQYAVYTYGGFYMDMDIEVVKNMDSLLSRPYVLGAETEYGIEAGVFGAEKGSPVIKACLDWYRGKSFVNPDGTFNMRGCPLVMMESIRNKYQVRISSEFVESVDTVILLPREFLTAKSSETGVVTKTKNTITIHHFAGSWLNTTPWSRTKHKMKTIAGRILGEGFVRLINKAIH